MNQQDKKAFDALCQQIRIMPHGQTILTKIALGKLCWHEVKVKRSEQFAYNETEYHLEINEHHDDISPQDCCQLLHAAAAREETEAQPVVPPEPALDDLDDQTLADTLHRIKKILKAHHKAKKTSGEAIKPLWKKHKHREEAAA